MCRKPLIFAQCSFYFNLFFQFLFQPFFQNRNNPKIYLVYVLEIMRSRCSLKKLYQRVVGVTSVRTGVPRKKSQKTSNGFLVKIFYIQSYLSLFPKDNCQKLF
uniref:Uncharacterized protein n=1 Tax=Meloidogyne enterolobii TaxID=390850 RepID=A0A6V7XID6_MELEN|nr:unnamed protein product [Meloidogyne enterolobii]